MSRPTAVVVGVGAERGLGAALARRFVRAGCHVLVAGRTRDRIERVAATLRTAGGSAEAVAPGTDLAPVDLVVFNVGDNQFIDSRATCVAQFESFWRTDCLA